MSGTRSPSRAAPAIDVGKRPNLVIVAHGERGGERSDLLVHRLCKRLRAESCYATVGHAFMSKPPKLDAALSALPPGPVVIAPLFMTDGYFVAKAIPQAIARHDAKDARAPRPVHILTPAGLHPDLPELIVALASDIASNSGKQPDKVHVALIAHGSENDPASHRATRQIAEAITTRNSFAGIHIGFLEEPPFVSDVLSTMPGPAVVVGLFASDGMHGAVDLPEAVTASGRTDLLLAPPLSTRPAFIDLICNQLKAAACPHSQAAE